MRTHLAILISGISCGVGLLIWQDASVAGPNSSPGTLVSTASSAVVPMAANEGVASPSYVGSKSCKKCHLKVHKSWAKTKMGQAFEILMPGNSKEEKVKHNLDPDKDYTKDETCLKCHTTGFGQAGGYQTPDPNDKKAVRKAKKLQSVGCECCHGPGSEYAKLFKEIQKSKRSYKVEELYAAGLRKMDKAVCLECHNETSPTVQKDTPFDYKERVETDTHEHETLKQREE